MRVIAGGLFAGLLMTAMAPAGYSQKLGVVDQAVADAKKAGKKEATLPRWGSTPAPWAETVDEFLNTYTFMVAEPQSVTVTRDEYKLETWTKLRVSEVLYRQKDLPLNGPVAPPALGSLNQGELLFHVEGGELAINGVTVRQDGGPQLSMGKKYLLIMHLESKGTVGIPASGEAGIYEVIGEQLKPVAASAVYDNLRTRGLSMLQSLRVWLRWRTV